jgi:C4-dicarboxylate-specific signal transduction histidine kinase
LAAAAAVFVADTLTPPDCVVGGLYVVVVLMAGQFCTARGLWLVAMGCAALTVLAQFLAHRYVLANDQATYIGAFNTTVTILAVGLSCSLIVRGRSTEAALRRAQADLANVSRMTTLGELTASIAHEVNQPIAAVVTNAGACLRWLAGERPDLDKARQAASRIVRDGARAADIITRIRALFARAAPERRSIDLNQLIRETTDLLGAEIKRHAVATRLNLAADLPAIFGDRVQLQQVLVNLITNGVEAMAAVHGPRELLVVCERSADGEVLVSVCDSGDGLPDEPPDRLFNAFFTTKPEGTGMGLSISRSIIEAHGGLLSATANKPKGAIFRFALPVGEASDAGTAS